jgi:hypothetical protein
LYVTTCPKAYNIVHIAVPEMDIVFKIAHVKYSIHQFIKENICHEGGGNEEPIGRPKRRGTIV